MLEIKNLSVSYAGKKLLRGVDISIGAGARHLLRGANGSGKTTLVQTVAGAPDYEVTGGEILLDGKNIIDMPADARARLGLFAGSQHVPEIPGLSVMSLIKHAMAARDPEIKMSDILGRVAAARTALNIPEEWMGRGINVGFSGGERKRLMFLMLMLLKPKIAILDEPDSGADATAQELFAEIIGEMSADGTGFLIVSHQEKFAQMLAPTQISVLDHGQIVI